MNPHEHNYIAGTIGDECDFCGLLKSTIESMENTKYTDVKDLKGNKIGSRVLYKNPYAKIIEQERNDIWKWIGENSWLQDSPTGEVRVIDVDELADYWRKQDRK